MNNTNALKRTLTLSSFLFAVSLLNSTSVNAAAGDTLWTYTTGDFVVASPSIADDGTVYVGSWDDKLYAINPDGTFKWSYTTGNDIYGSPAIGSDGTIYVGSDDNKLYAINSDGTLKWSYTTGDLVHESSPAIGIDGTIYVGSHDNKLYAINSDGTLKWSYTTGDQIKSSPAIGSDGTIYFGSNDNKLYALYYDGTLKWSYNTGNEVWGSGPAIGSDGTIYMGSKDPNNKLYAINSDGTLKWSYTTGSWVGSSAAIGIDGTVYVGSNDHNFYALYPDGTLKWSYTTGHCIHISTAAIGSDGTVYVGSNDSKFYAFNSDGTLKWSYTTGRNIYSSPAITSDGTIYVGSSDGKLYAFDSGTSAGLADSPWPKVHHDLRNTGSIQTPAGTLCGISDYIAQMNPTDFDKPAQQGALVKQFQDFCLEIGDLNPVAALARLNNIRKRVEKWVVAEDDQTVILSMIDQLTDYFGFQETLGKWKGKDKKGVDLSAVSLPKKLELFQNNPNPFNPSTTISYSVPEGIQDYVTLKVYDLRGRLVRTLVDRIIGAGTYSVYWDGTDEAGRQVSSGIYLYRMKAGKFVQTRKMVLMK